MFNIVLEKIHQVLGNLVQNYNMTQTYVDEDDPWLVILTAEEFAIRLEANSLKGYSPGQVVFGRDTILPIKLNFDWELIRHQTDMHINEDNIRKTIKRLDYGYTVGDKVMLTNNNA